MSGFDPDFFEQLGTLRSNRRNFKKGIDLEEARRKRHDLIERIRKGKKARTLRMRRGYNRNQINRHGDAFFAFISRIEGLPDGPWYLHFDCLEAAWFVDLWNVELAEMRNARGRTYQQVVLDFLDGRPFGVAFQQSTQEERHALSQVYSWYVDRLVSTTMPQPQRGTFECYVDRAWRHIAAPVPSAWWDIRLIEREDDDDENNGIFIEHFEAAEDEDDTASLRDLAYSQQIPEPFHGILEALHYPNIEPGAPDGGFEELEPVDDDDEGQEGFQFDAPVFLKTIVDRLRRFIDDTVTAIGALNAPLALAGGGPTFHVNACAYSGSNAANPMIGGGQPFVGVYNVGQGNLNALIDGGHHVTAYFDFGYTLKPANGPAPFVHPCFCDEPTIILSHWDKDHYGMSLKVPRSYSMRWIVPQQRNSANSATVHGKVKKAGGRFCIWRDGLGDTHIRFPWGYLERCTAPVDPNGSGIAAFVCVREPNPAAAYVAPAGAVANGVQESPVGAEAQRANAAAAAMPGRLGALGLAAVPHIGDIAGAIAATVAALPEGLTITNSHNGLTRIGNVAAAAANAALTAGNVVAAVNGVAFNELTLAKRNALRPKIVTAANNGAIAAGRRPVCDAVVLALVGNPVPAAKSHYPDIVFRALQPADAAPGVAQGPGERAAGEGFVLLNGDANFNWVRSMNAAPPQIVALTAMHHGSMLEDGETLYAGAIPWAPGSAGALAAHDAGQANAHVDEQAAEAAASGNAAVLEATTRVAGAAAKAIYRTAAVGIPTRDAIIATGRIGIQFAAAAAAAALACQRALDAKATGYAAVAAAVLEPAITPIGTCVAKVAQLIADRRNVGVRNTGHIEATGLFTTGNSAGILATVNGAGPVTALNAVNASAAAAVAAPNIINDPTYDPIAARITREAVTAYDAGQAQVGNGRAAMMAAVGGGAAAEVTTPLNQTAMGGWPGTIAEVARIAARLAAESAAAQAANVAPELVAAALTAVMDGTVARATAVRNDPLAAQIAYSYGVTAAGSYTYRAATIGNLGHPHPLAIAQYEARGWTQRINTSARANLGVQADGVSPRGHAALGWDNGNDAALARGQINYQCPTCNQALTFEQ